MLLSIVSCGDKKTKTEIEVIETVKTTETKVEKTSENITDFMDDSLLLIEYITQGNLVEVKSLIENGANINIVDERETQL